jgi:nucleolar protein 14
MQRRNKVGGLVDRRFAENDPNITSEDKMMERFVQEKMRTHKKSAVFNLEDDETEEGLTHMGKPLMFDDAVDEMRALQDDFDESDLSGSDDSEAQDARRALKRARLEEAADDESREQPERKKTKNEIYEEIIAKSKAHKIDRQMKKEADEDLRMAIDKELPELQSLLYRLDKPKAKEDQGPAALIAGMDKETLSKDYDTRVKKLAADKRSQPVSKSKTEEEQADEVASKLKELEQQRIQRMKGIVDSDSDDDEVRPRDRAMKDVDKSLARTDDDNDDHFGLGRGIKIRATATELGLDDEDDFLM